MNEFAQKILSWYDTHKRDLPWRNISDPYKIWVSEIILQQTRISQGYDYYLRFIKAFPTIKDLAKASEDEVLCQWQGLGYYSRARNMREAAQTIIKEHRGVFPQNYKEVLSLKGIGEYTAAAICSFAYNAPYAVVDGNVYRVLSRYFGIVEPIDTTKGKKLFAQLAQQMLSVKHSADYNQGIMDFGAIQCKPQSPECELCVLADSCVAHNEGSVTKFPIKQKALKINERYFVFVKVVTPNGIWLHKRNANDIWKGLYEYPLLEFDHQANENEVMQHEWIKSLPAKGTWKVLKKGVKHILTHQIIYADLYLFVSEIDIPSTDNVIVVNSECIEQYAMPQLLQKLIRNEGKN